RRGLLLVLAPRPNRPALAPIARAYAAGGGLFPAHSASAHSAPPLRRATRRLWRPRGGNQSRRPAKRPFAGQKGRPRGWRGLPTVARSDLVVLADDLAPSSGRACAAPARPEDEREQRAHRADDQQDPPDRVQVEAVRRDVDGPDENRARRDQDHAHTDTHIRSFTLLQGKRGSSPIGYAARTPPGAPQLPLPADPCPGPRDARRGRRVPRGTRDADPDA